MTRPIYAGLFLLGITINLGVALIEAGPGTMDADYYYAVGFRIAKYAEWNEPFLWNYLNDLDGLPQPAFTYWMPLPALLSALGMKLTGLFNFTGARLGFLLLGGLIPPLTARLATTFTPHRSAGILSGLLAAFPVFYLPYISTPESFSLSMVLSGIIFLLITDTRLSAEDTKIWKRIVISFASGVICGLLHMTRADGFLWLVIVIWAITIHAQASRPQRMDSFSLSSAKSGIPAHGAVAKQLDVLSDKHTNKLTFIYLLPLGVACLTGYLLIAGPWFVRNLAAFTTLFPPGSNRALWITRYDELFVYPASNLNAAHWLASGLTEIVLNRLWAFGQNIQTAVVVQSSIFLFPIVILGVWSKRRDPRVRAGIAAWILFLFVMTIVFPFAGARGGFFHSGASLQPLILALVPAGMESYLRWGSVRRGWHADKARTGFGSILVGLAVLLTAYISWQWVIGKNWDRPVWNETYRVYSRIEQELIDIGVDREAIVMVNNPPGYYATTGRWSIVIPDGPIEMTLEAGERYQAQYLLLDKNSPEALRDSFLSPEDQPGLCFLETIEGVHLFVLDNRSVPPNKVSSGCRTSD
jgi:hypothetical protein